MKILLTIFFLLFALANNVLTQHVYDSTKINPNVLKLALKLNKHKTIESVFVGFSGSISKTYQIYRKLRLNSTKEELVELSFHPNPLIRAYSFWGLAERRETGILNLLLSHINDTTQIETQFGCVGEHMQLIDFMIKLVIPQYVFTSDYMFQNQTLLNGEEREILDSNIIFSDHVLNYTGIALLHQSSKMNYYNRIKELSLRQNIYAIVALAKYNNYEDTSIIKNSYYLPNNKDSFMGTYYYTFWAFSEFPNKCFENFTIQVFDSVISLRKDNHNFKTLYKAIASFKNPLLYKYLVSKDKNQNYYSFIGMTDFACEQYDSLMFYLWANDKIITNDAFNYLYKKDKAKSLELLIKTIEPENKYLEIPDLRIWIDNNYKKTLDLMFLTLYAENKIKAMDILHNKLRTSDYRELEFYCAKAKSIKDTSVINTILMRLKTDEVNTFRNDNYWYLMEVIVGFNESRYDELLINSILQNEYAVKKRSVSRKTITENIELMRWSMSNTKSLDQLQLDKYR